jgi:hypothetical protein
MLGSTLRTLVHLTLAATLSSTAVAQSTATETSAAIFGEQVGCNSEQAFWSWSYADLRNPPTDLPPLSALELPHGAVTKAWSCRVGAHTLTIRSVLDLRPPEGPCGACGLGLVSVWLDRTAIASREAVGDIDLDIGRDHERALSYVRLLRDRLILCGWEIDPSASEETSARFRENCSTTLLDGWSTRPDDGFVPPSVRTPFRLDLVISKGSTCAGASRHLALPSSFESDAADDLSPPRDPSFDKRRMEVAWSTNETGRTRTGRIDLDNDGQLDEVRVEPWMVAGDHIFAERWEWAGASGQTHRVPVFDLRHARSSELDYQERFHVGFVYKPVRWRGRTLLYVRRLPISTGSEEYIAAGVRTRREAPLTRGLIELFPDGSAVLLCGWAPRSRPEDRL